MAAVVSIELLLDSETEARVRRDWESLAQAGLSSLAPHRSPSNRPHITLMVRPALADTPFVDALAQLPVAVALERPMVFRHGDRGVLAWQVAPTEELQRLHAAVHRQAPPGEDAPHTGPGEWVPHVTLARRLRMDSLAEAMGLLGPCIGGAGTSLRRWDSHTASVTRLS